MARERIQLSVKVLEFYAENYGGIEEVAKKISQSEKTVKLICQGQLTPRQMREFAKICHIAFGFLFLENPLPIKPPKIADFRIRDENKELDPLLTEILKDIEYKQDWYREYRLENDYSEIDYIGRYSLDDDVLTIVKDIRTILNVEKPKYKENEDTYFKELVKKIEETGTLVFLANNIGGSNTHSLDTNISGFCLTDRIAPIIYINRSDKSKGRIFTLMHEFAHLLIDKSGISNSYKDSEDDIEIFCNEIAGEYLVPLEEFEKLWEQRQIDKENLKEVISRIAENFKISPVVVALRAYKSHFINFDLFDEIREEFKPNKTENPKLSPKAHKSIRQEKNSRTFTKIVANQIESSKMTFREASNLLNIPIGKVWFYVSS